VALLVAAMPSVLPAGAARAILAVVLLLVTADILLSVLVEVTLLFGDYIPCKHAAERA
jgi:hypothetical protein